VRPNGPPPPPPGAPIEPADTGQPADDDETETEDGDDAQAVPGWPSDQPEPDQVLWPRKL
jgi:hypothetical protein